MEWWRKNRERYQELIAEYGTIAIGTYLVIAAISFTAFVMAIRMGFDVGDGGASAGTFVAAWVGIKAIQPLRIGATLLATPVVASVLRRRREPASEPAEPAAPRVENEEA